MTVEASEKKSMPIDDASQGDKVVQGVEVSQEDAVLFHGVEVDSEDDLQATASQPPPNVPTLNPAQFLSMMHLDVGASSPPHGFFGSVSHSRGCSHFLRNGIVEC
jgi:hypothetical protein